jgi:hypothetical protein
MTEISFQANFICLVRTLYLFVLQISIILVLSSLSLLFCVYCCQYWNSWMTVGWKGWNEDILYPSACPDLPMIIPFTWTYTVDVGHVITTTALLTHNRWRPCQLPASQTPQHHALSNRSVHVLLHPQTATPTEKSGKGKDKCHPRTGHEGSEEEQRLALLSR